MIKEIERFETISEQGGKHTIVCLQDLTTIISVEGIKHVIRGMIHYMTLPEHSKASSLGPHGFRIVETGEIVRRVE